MQENLKKNQKIEIVFEGISSERMSKYIDQAGSNKEKALSLYNENTRTSELFYTPLQGFEILLRNTVHKAISRKYGENWLFEERFPFEHIQRKMIQNIIKKNSLITTPPKLIAELSFGFWTSLFGRKYEEVWRHILRRIFTGYNGVLVRKEIFSRLNEVRELTNRIAHHEPIFNRDKSKDLESIFYLSEHICPVTKEWMEKETQLKLPKDFRLHKNVKSLEKTI